MTEASSDPVLAVPRRALDYGSIVFRNAAKAMTLRQLSFRLDDIRGQRPLIIILAPSERSPSYEAQVDAVGVREVARRSRAALVMVLAEGTSTIDGDAMDDPSADELRTLFGVDPADFLIVLIGADGKERHRDDTPLQAGVMIERLSDGAYGGPRE